MCQSQIFPLVVCVQVRRASWPSRGWTSSTLRCRRRPIRTRRLRSLFYRRQEESWWARASGWETELKTFVSEPHDKSWWTWWDEDDNDFILTNLWDDLMTATSGFVWTDHWLTDVEVLLQKLGGGCFFFFFLAPVPYLTRFINIWSFKTLPAFLVPGLSSSSQAIRLLHWNMKDKYYIIMSHKVSDVCLKKSENLMWTLNPWGTK